jgi:hypothetical protein
MKPTIRTVARSAVFLSALLGLFALISAEESPTDRYKTHSLFVDPQSTEEAGQIAPGPPTVPPLTPPRDHNDDGISDEQINPLVEERPLANSRSITQSERYSWANPDTWQAPAHQDAGQASNAPGATNTSPEDRDRPYATMGRGIPINR